MTPPTSDQARCFPILASLNLAETLDYYREQLGFTGEAFGDYAILRRDAMELHFWLAQDRIHPEHTACYIRGGQVTALHAEYAARGVPLLSAFVLMPWGMTEFNLIDPHGNLLRFGYAPQDLPRAVPS